MSNPGFRVHSATRLGEGIDRITSGTILGRTTAPGGWQTWAMADVYAPDPDRYDGRMPYRRCGRSGLKLPAVTIGCWHNFGDDTPLQTQRDILRTEEHLGRAALTAARAGVKIDMEGAGQ